MFVIEYVWMRYWKFLKKFPVQTIVVKTVGKGDLDNLLEAIGNDFSDFDSSYCLLSAPDEGDAPRAAEQRIGLIWLGVTRQSDEG